MTSWLLLDFIEMLWIVKNRGWWLEAESNCRHADFQSAALPTELSNHAAKKKCDFSHLILKFWLNT